MEIESEGADAPRDCRLRTSTTEDQSFTEETLKFLCVPP
jgi:hypothetical protein